MIPLNGDCPSTSAINGHRDIRPGAVGWRARGEIETSSLTRPDRSQSPTVMILKSRLIAIKILVCDLRNVTYGARERAISVGLVLIPRRKMCVRMYVCMHVYIAWRKVWKQSNICKQCISEKMLQTKVRRFKKTHSMAV